MAPVCELVRVTRDERGSLVIGTGLPGRGAWFCRDGEMCLELASKRHAFSRALRAEIKPEAVEDLRARLSTSTEDKPGDANKPSEEN